MREPGGQRLALDFVALFEEAAPEMQERPVQVAVVYVFCVWLDVEEGREEGATTVTPPPKKKNERGPEHDAGGSRGRRRRL